MSSTELARRSHEHSWPPASVQDLMAFFVEKEQTDPTFAGMADCANDFVRNFYNIIGTTDGHLVTNGNKTAALSFGPEVLPPNKLASEALIAGAYKLANAKMVDTHESPGHNRYHVLYEGIVDVNKGDGDIRRVPVAFNEVYLTDDRGACIDMEWSMRTNYPPREQIEIEKIQKRPISRNNRADWSLNLISDIAKIEEIPEPDYHLPKAA